MKSITFVLICTGNVFHLHCFETWSNIPQCPKLYTIFVAGDIYSVVPNSSSDCLAELASEYNEDPEELKKRVL